VITPFFPSIDSFVGSYIFDQVNEIRKQTEFDVRIVKTVSLFSSEKDYEFNGFKVSIFKTIDFPFFIFPGLFNKINRKRFLDFLIKKGIKNVKYSHSHVTYPASYLVDDLICKKIVQHHGLDVLQLQNGRTGFAKKIQKNFLIKNSLNHLNKADLNIGVSQLVLDKLNEFQGYYPKNGLVLYNGVDTSKFFPIKKNCNKIFTIGCVANFWEIKDHITLIKSVKKIVEEGKEIKLRLIGSGPTLSTCEEFVKNNNLSKNIIFEKEIEHDKLNQFFNEIDLFVLPSYYEALGCVYLESWATNTPFIAVKGQGVSEVIPDVDKMLFEAENSSQLVEKILFFMNNSFTLKPVNKFDIRNTISDFLTKDIFLDD
jgi:glycosyltransferase involved in cell wall biosynthesis